MMAYTISYGDICYLGNRATVHKSAPHCFANQHECRCCRGFRKHRQCTHYVPTIQPASSSHYTPNPYIYPQCQCNRKKHYTPNRNMHPQCISHYTPNGYIHAQFNSQYTPIMKSALSSTSLPLVCSAVYIVFLFTQKMVENVIHFTSQYEERLPTEVVIRTSDAHGRRCSEQIFPDVSFL